MNDQEKQVVVQRMKDGYETEPVTRDEEQPGGSGLYRLHAALRGRYVWAILLGLVLGLGGGFIGYKSYVPRYGSTGLVSVQLNQQTILYRTEDKVLRDPGTYVQQQMDLIMEPRVISYAMSNSQWTRLGRGNSPEAIKAFTKSVKVRRDRNSPTIAVTFTDGDQQAALIGATVILKAYMEIWQEENEKSSQATLNELDKLRNRYNNMINNAEARIVEIAGEYGEESLVRMHQNYLAEQQRLESELHTLSLEIAKAEREMKTQPKEFEPLTSFEIAGQDKRMQTYLQQLDSLEMHLQDLSLHHKETHPSVLEAKARLENVIEKIDDYAAQFNEQYKEKESTRWEVALENEKALLEKYEKQREHMRQMVDEAKGKAVVEGKKLQDIANLRLEIADHSAGLEMVETRLEQLNTEAAAGGRVHISNMPDPKFIELDNKKDKRNMTAAGSMGGFMAGFGLVALIGLVDRRYRSIEDAQATIGKIRMLGMLPKLPEHLDDLEEASMAAHCVHQIRGALQLKMSKQRSYVFSVTSSSPSDGKTSLTLALGMSLAASGSRTLVIDFDLTGHGLTSRVEQLVRRRIGQILLQQGLIDDDRLAQGLEQAREKEQRLGDALIELGYLTEDQAQQAATIQEQSPLGLVDFINGEVISQCIADTGTTNLHILPVGTVNPGHVISMSPDTVERLIEEVRNDFDVVLIDTGPVPGALEASLVASRVDGVIFTLSQGLHRQVVQRALLHLESNGAKIAGVVFNRANARDIEQSGTVSRSRMSTSPEAMPVMDQIEAGIKKNRNGQSHFGPLADATSWSLPAIRSQEIRKKQITEEKPVSGKSKTDRPGLEDDDQDLLTKPSVRDDEVDEQASLPSEESLISEAQRILGPPRGD